jgi:hypothetical protein
MMAMAMAMAMAVAVVVAMAVAVARGQIIKLLQAIRDGDDVAARHIEKRILQKQQKAKR